MKHVDPKALEEFRAAGPCEWCGRPLARRQASHAYARAMAGTFHLDHWINLTGTCNECETNHHTKGLPSTRELVQVIANREGLPAEDLHRAIQRIRFEEAHEDSGARIHEILAEILGEQGANRPSLPRPLGDGDGGVYLPPFGG